MADLADDMRIHDDWLAVSTEGFASMNAGRSPAHLAKELVHNSLDAAGGKPGHIELTMQPNSACGGVVITCRDDGCGMANLHDLRTVFFTSKTDSHLQRGRMGRGFKEMLCLALGATVVSGPRKVQFLIEDGRRITRTSGNCPASTASESSVEALSTTMTSRGTRVPL